MTDQYITNPDTPIQIPTQFSVLINNRRYLCPADDLVSLKWSQTEPPIPNQL